MTRDEARYIFNNLVIGCTVLYEGGYYGKRVSRKVTSIEKCDEYGRCSGTSNERLRVCNGNMIGFDNKRPECISCCKTKEKCFVQKIIHDDFIEEDEFML